MTGIGSRRERPHENLKAAIARVELTEPTRDESRIQTSCLRAPKNGPIRAWVFFTEAESAQPDRVSLRIHLAYKPPLLIRSFRLPKKLNGSAAESKWRITLDGWCEVKQFPSRAVVQEVKGGFPVIHYKCNA